MNKLSFYNSLYCEKDLNDELRVQALLQQQVLINNYTQLFAKDIIEYILVEIIELVTKEEPDNYIMEEGAPDEQTVWVVVRQLETQA